MSSARGKLVNLFSAELSIVTVNGSGLKRHGAQEGTRSDLRKHGLWQKDVDTV